MSDPATTTAVEGEEKPKLQRIKEKVEAVLNYDKLWIVDAALIGCHLLALLILAFQFLMFVPLFGIRGVRLALYMLAKKTGEDKWFDMEFKFRKYSCYGYFFVGIIVQFLTMVTNFCRVAGDSAECRKAYFLTMLILLVLYQGIDVVLYLVVKKAYEARDNTATETAVGGSKGVEMAKNPYGDGAPAAHNMA